jgi:predicted DCC family thiol-disulfide oxidoreductase YuxK
LKTENHKIILFDGVCNLCNTSVNFLISHDKNDIFRFASLQSDIGIELQKKFNLDPEELKTFFLIDGDKYYSRSTAALRAAKELGFPWNLAYIFILVPPFIRNGVYRLISRYRYKWFGKRSTCRLPSPEEKAKFL